MADMFFISNIINARCPLRNHFNNARIFKAFCDESRLRILELLRSGEKCACILLQDLHIGQPTLSHHMKILCESGVVTGRKEGKWTHYSLNTEGSRHAVAMLRMLLTTSENAVPAAKALTIADALTATEATHG